MKNLRTTKSQVRQDFKYLRNLMREIDLMMKQEITDTSEEGVAGQLANELSAIASTFRNYLDDLEWEAS